MPKDKYLGTYLSTLCDIKLCQIKCGHRKLPTQSAPVKYITIKVTSFSAGKDLTFM